MSSHDSPSAPRGTALSRWLVLAILLILLTASAASAGPGATSAQPLQGQYIIIGWNDLGMHCYNPSFQYLAVLPPYNNLWAQVIRVGDPPQIVTAGIKVEYSFPDNTYSVGKTDFWTYAQHLFGVNLAPNIGLTGKGLSGQMDAKDGYFVAEGIPLTEYRDSATTTRYPYQLAELVARDASTGVELARNTIVAPVSTEMDCYLCHADDGDATTAYPITPTGNVFANILALHDYLSASMYPAGHQGPLLDPNREPILCAECHSDNALGLAGVTGVESLSNAMHKRHSMVSDITPDINGCYKCHPGPQTQCLRGTMAREGITCINCHGTISNVAQNPNPWLNEPRCDSSGCHGSEARQTQALYRHSQGHGNLYCEACHDSTHAIAKSREPNDWIKFINLQGSAETLQDCMTCHGVEPSGSFQHLASFVATPTATSPAGATATPTRTGTPAEGATSTPTRTATPHEGATSTPTRTPTRTSTRDAAPTSTNTPAEFRDAVILPLILRAMP